jgi:DNA-directed RNA polymerase subunit H (RpoH/RPB5)
MEPPKEVLKAVQQLDRIWTTYRVERCSLNDQELTHVSCKKKLEYWTIKRFYADPRQNGKRTSLCVILIPPSLALGTEFANIIIEHCVDQEHVVIVRKSESKQASHAFGLTATFFWEIISYEDLNMDVLSHVLVPKYRLLISEEDRKVAFDRMGTTDPSKFPLMKFRKDPIARRLGFRVGEVIEKKVPSITTCFTVSYRFVVSDKTEDEEEEVAES